MTIRKPELESDTTALIASVVAKLWVRRWLVMTITVLATLAFIGAAFLIKPVYSSSTLLISVAANRSSGNLGTALGQLGGIAALTGLNLNSGAAETDEALAVLQSREFTERFIDDLKLMPELFPEKWDANKHAWKGDALHQPTAEKAVRIFDSKVRTLSKDKKTGLITLGIQWTDRAEAAAWANELVRRLNEEMRFRAISSATSSIEYLEKELRATDTVPIREAISRLMEAQIKQRMLANVTPEYAFRVVDKAMPPDQDSPVFPKKLKFALVGTLVGLACGLIVVLAIEPTRRIYAGITRRLNS